MAGLGSDAVLDEREFSVSRRLRRSHEKRYCPRTVNW